ncbi:DNA cytosine methyltransferase [Euzebya pacifica]|nr:DNA cytosine methyltransferase [Euzebya pacifica]
MTPTAAPHQGRRPTVAGCFSGIGGLELGFQRAGFRSLWCAEIDANPSAVLAARFPDTPNLGDVREIGSPAAPDVLVGGFPCFPAGTLVDTADGFRPIETIREGDRVRTHMGRYMPVVQLMKRDATDTLNVKVMGAPEFTTTAEHPFYVRRKGQTWDPSIGVKGHYRRVWSDPEWVEAGLLDKDCFVGFQLDTPDPDQEPIGPALGYVIGRWLGDGWVRDSRRPQNLTGRRGSRVESRWWNVFVCCDPSEADVLRSAITAAGFATGKAQRVGVTVRFRIGSKDLCKLLSGFGRHAHGKRIPGWVYRLPIEDQQAIWQGWVDADGYRETKNRPSPQVKATTVSEQLAHGMARIARNVHRRAVSIHKVETADTTVIEVRTVNQRDWYQVVLPTRNREAFVEGDWVWAPVRTITEADPTEVFNIGVQDDESYTAYGITVHNCQDLSRGNAERRGIKEGTRSGLFFDFARIADTTRARWVVIENVEGLLDSNGGRDLATVIGVLADLGYVGGWRLVDARSFGVPQARRRLLVVGHRGGSDAVRRALLEPEAREWGARPRVAAWRSATQGVDRGTRTGGGQLGFDLSGGVEPEPVRVWRKAGRAQTSEDAETWEPGGYANTLNLYDTAVARTVHLVIDPASGRPRRLTEVEAERLQGFPDGWTDVEVRGRPMSSTRRYEMCGNAVPVPMAAWIASRILAELPRTYGPPIGDLVAEHRQATPVIA